MPSKTSKKKPVVLPTIPKELIDQIADGPMTAEAVNAASMAFKKALIERALSAELSHHLGYAPGGDKPEGGGNDRPLQQDEQQPRRKADGQRPDAGGIHTVVVRNQYAHGTPR